MIVIVQRAIEDSEKIENVNKGLSIKIKFRKGSYTVVFSFTIISLWTWYKVR